MQNIIIRRAKKSDCPRLLELVHELAQYEKAPGEVTITREEFIEGGFGENPVWWAFVAEVKGVICGMALYYIRFSTWKGKQIYLEDIYVSETLRGNGVGTLLFEQLVIEARENDFKGITWQVLEWNEPAIRFYKKYHTLFDPGWINCRMEIRR
ncbi:MAG: GNAT family N-acetyltransferase [Dysgonamonadaceae bacterium]|jgi:GNAT superfamily N-acetyltransferase|nr:GNAT family N-acetyltransferase [Dysgonamonadaceae bacterium]